MGNIGEFCNAPIFCPQCTVICEKIIMLDCSFECQKCLPSSFPEEGLWLAPPLCYWQAKQKVENFFYTQDIKLFFQPEVGWMGECVDPWWSRQFACSRQTEFSSRFFLLCLTQFVTNVGVAIFSNYSSNGSSQQVIIGRKMSQPAIDEESINSQQSIIFQT